MKVFIVTMGLIGLLLSSSLLAFSSTSIETVQVEVLGHGSTRQEATFDALAEAVRQVHGVEITAQRSLTSSSRELTFTDADGAQTSLALSADQSGNVTANTEGYISGYRVLSATPHNPGFSVRLRVDLPVYRGPGMRTHETRRKMAVYPFDASPGLRLFGQQLDPAMVSERLTQAVVQSITQTRRFAVLERERTQAIHEERRLLSDPSVPAYEKARLGATLGADYVVIGSIIGLDVDAREQVSGLTGESSVKVDGSIVLELRILSPTTRQVHWTDTMTIPAETVFETSGRATGMVAFQQSLWALAADRVTQRAISSIYPLRIIDLSGDQIVLNQGGSQLQAGMNLKIFALGEELFDPYTGESLGRNESEVASARVERVTDRVTYARVISGSVTVADPTAYLARRDEEVRDDDKTSQENIRGTRRSIRLPHDR